jgi:hypothetical protein
MRVARTRFVVLEWSVAVSGLIYSGETLCASPVKRS